MKAFDQFVIDFRKEYGRVPRKSDVNKLLSPYLLRELKTDDFDGRITNNCKHLNK